MMPIWKPSRHANATKFVTLSVMVRSRVRLSPRGHVPTQARAIRSYVAELENQH